MGLLTNPRDKFADKDDVAEVVRRKGGRATISDIVEMLDISEKRAKEIVDEARGPEGQWLTRVYTHKKGSQLIIQNRY